MSMIDWGRVKTLNDEIGAAAFREVVALFLEEVEEVIARLREAPEPAEFESDLHFLKGCALNLGFRRLATLCAEGETRAATGDPATVEIAPVLEVYAASRSEFLERGDGIDDAA